MSGWRRSTGRARGSRSQPAPQPSGIDRTATRRRAAVLVVAVLALVGAVAAAFFPRRKSPLQLAALTAALLAGFELVLTYWLYTYIPWFYPFAAIALGATGSAPP